MSSSVLLFVGIAVFGLALIGILITVHEFRQLPRWQEPEFDSVAAQAQPDEVSEPVRQGKPVRSREDTA